MWRRVLAVPFAPVAPVIRTNVIVPNRGPPAPAHVSVLYCMQLLMDATATLVGFSKSLASAVVDVRAAKAAAKAAAAAAAADAGQAASGSSDGPAVQAGLSISASLSGDGEESDVEEDTPGVTLGGVLTWPANACLNVQVRHRESTCVLGQCAGLSLTASSLEVVEAGGGGVHNSMVTLTPVNLSPSSCPRLLSAVSVAAPACGCCRRPVCRHCAAVPGP